MTKDDVMQYLFKLLDDIDTVGDTVKGDDAAYRKAVEAIHKKRFDVASTASGEVMFFDGWR